VSTVKGVARINAIRIDQHDNITGLDLALAIEGKSLEVVINVPEGHDLDSAFAEGINLTVAVS
jgi:hypothetical protein